MSGSSGTLARLDESELSLGALGLSLDADCARSGSDLDPGHAGITDASLPSPFLRRCPVPVSFL